MMRKKVILITGAAGEIGHALVEYLSEQNTGMDILTFDLADLPADLAGKTIHIKGSITDRSLMERLVSEYEIDQMLNHFYDLLDGVNQTMSEREFLLISE